MANLLTAVEFDSYPCIDPRSVFEEAQRLGYQTSHWAGLPNSFILPRGKLPGHGYVLLYRAHVDTLDFANDSGTHSLKFYCGSDRLQLSNLRILRATSLYVNDLTPHANTPCLVELVDCRQILGMSFVNKSYNVRCPAPPTLTYSSVNGFYADSLNAGAGWTWQTMLDSLWSFLPAGASPGTSPTLPYTPAGNPENFRFLGCSAWEAYHTILAKIDCSLVYDPRTHTFTVIRLGSTQTAIADYFLQKLIIADFHAGSAPVRNLAAEIPATIRVCFRRQELHYGTEKDIQRTTDNWVTSAVYTVDVASGISGAVSGTILELWDELPAIYTYAGSVTNSADLSTRATEVAANYVNTLSRSCAWNKRLYRNLHIDSACLPGSQWEAIRWFDTGYGMFTEFNQRQGEDANSTQDALRSGGSGAGSTPVTSGESGFSSRELGHPAIARIKPSSLFQNRHFTDAIAPPGFAQFNTPHFPFQLQIVEVVSGVVNASGCYDGYIQRYDPASLGSPTDTVACWIYAVDIPGSLTTGDKILGRVNGSLSHSSDIRPLVLVHGSGTQVMRFELTADLALGGTANAKRLDWTGSAYAKVGDTLTVRDFTTTPGSWRGVSGYQGWMAFMKDRSSYEIIWMERIARWIHFTLPSALTTSDASKSSTTVYDYWDGKNPGSTVTLYNPAASSNYIFAGASGARGLACYDDIEDKYKIVQIQC